MKQKIRLNESQLQQIIKESVKTVLNEMAMHNKETGVVSDYNYRIKNGVSVPKGEDWEWRNDGDIVDDYFWFLRREAERSGELGDNGYPKADYVNKWMSRHYKDACLRYGCGVNHDKEGNATPEDIYDYIDHVLYYNEK